MANRTSVEKLDYRELILLSIAHLLTRMSRKNTPDKIKDHIATVLVSKSLPQTLEHSGVLNTIQTVIDPLKYGITESDIDKYVRSIITRRDGSKENTNG